MKSIFIALLILFCGNVFSQIELAEDKVSWSFSVEQNGDEAFVIGKIRVVEHWHINAAKLPAGSFSVPTTIVLKKTPNFELVGSLIEPKPIEKYDKYADENLIYHEGTVIFKQKIKIKSEKDFELNGTFSFQTCNDVKCLPNHSANFKVKVKGVKAEDIANDQKKLISEFTKVTNDEATHKNGSSYVLVNGKWNEVPKGNSVAFYKKYLILTQKDEK
ncbi:MAG: protein-disulfide reductase DsbD domain-containing protein [Flavobacteriia bacterium]|jgi:hypothetical protein